jgi:hypothetical protein
VQVFSEIGRARRIQEGRGLHPHQRQRHLPFFPVLIRVGYWGLAVVETRCNLLRASLDHVSTPLAEYQALVPCSCPSPRSP